MRRIAFLLIFFILIADCIFAKDYVIGDGDVLQISVWGSPELSLSVIVRPDGKISIPALGEIKASGLTPMELKKIIEKELAHIMKKPIVTVIVSQMTSYQVLVFGNGTVPGIHIFNKETSLLEFLTQLGSLENADLANAYLIRNKQKIKVGFYELFRKGDLNQDIILEPRDILFIPDNFKMRINIVGAIIKPTTIPYKEGLTILDIILAVDGFTEFAKKNDVLVIRKVNDKEIRMKVRVKDLMEGDTSENMNIMPGDFIVVEESFF